MNKPSVTDPRQPSGSALILVLLMIVLLATIAVSFLSTARVEQIATRNFTRQTAARGLADLATGEAMAQIAEGFNMTNDGALADYTEVITTQPGAITKYFFKDGNCSVNTEPSTFLYTTNGGDTVANLNNLANPGSDNAPTDPNTPTVTGVLTDQLKVPMQDVTNAQGDVIGRVAWYVDDESTKINLNAATRDRTTLNISTPRSMSLSAVPGIGTRPLTAISKIVDGTANNSSSMTNWSRFFRDGQGAKTLGLTPAQMAEISTAPLSDYHFRYTPWGTKRLQINTLTMANPDEWNNSVQEIYDALTSQELRNIYGSTFADKYTEEGLRQLAANMLQLRSADTRDYTTSLNSTKQISQLRAEDLGEGGIPQRAVGYTFYPIINKIGFSGKWSCKLEPGGDANNPDQQTAVVRINLLMFLELWNTARQPFSLNQNNMDLVIEVTLDSLSWQATHTVPADPANPEAPPQTYTFYYGLGSGPEGTSYLDPKDGDTWANQANYTPRNARENALQETPVKPGIGGEDLVLTFPIHGNTPGVRNNQLRWNDACQFTSRLTGSKDNAGNPIEIYGEMRFPNDGTTIDSIIARVGIKRIRLLRSRNDPTSIRDWALGQEVGPIDVTLDIPIQEGNKYVATDVLDYAQIPVPAEVSERVDGHIKTHLDAWSEDGGPPEYMTGWAKDSSVTWNFDNEQPTEIQIKGHEVKDPDKGIPGREYSLAANPWSSRANAIPADRIWTSQDDLRLFFAYDPGWEHLGGNTWPCIEFTDPATANGVYTCPADLGKIQTPARHRKLRFMIQPPQEVAVADGGEGTMTFIPDWAMLDVISFGGREDDPATPLQERQELAPVNLNGIFSGPFSPQPSPRANALVTLAAALDSTNTYGNLWSPRSANTPTQTKTMLRDASKIPADYLGINDPLNKGIYNPYPQRPLAKDVVKSLVTHLDEQQNVAWAKRTTTSTPAIDGSLWGSRRWKDSMNTMPGKLKNRLILPAEITEIAYISDAETQRPRDNTQGGGNRNVKRNEGRLSAFFPGLTLQGNFFTIYAYAQVLDKQGQVQSEAVTKTLVEVEQDPSVTTYPPKYQVKKLYTEPVAMP